MQRLREWADRREHRPEQSEHEQIIRLLIYELHEQEQQMADIKQIGEHLDQLQTDLSAAIGDLQAEVQNLVAQLPDPAAGDAVLEKLDALDAVVKGDDPGPQPTTGSVPGGGGTTDPAATGAPDAGGVPTTDVPEPVDTAQPDAPADDTAQPDAPADPADPAQG